MDKKIVGQFFGEKSDFGGIGKDIGMEKSEKKKNRQKIADFSEKTDFSGKILFLIFFPDSKNMQKIASDRFRTHPKYLEIAPSNYQAIDCTYYIQCKLFLYSLTIYLFIIPI